MKPLIVVLFALLSATPALGSPAAGPAEPSSSVELSEALRELAAARAEMERIREAVERDLASRDAELERLRDQVQRLEPVAADEDQRVAYGSAVRVEAGERVGDVVSFGDDVHVQGVVAGNATAFGGSVRVADGGRVLGDAVAFGGRVEVADGGVVEGDRIAMVSPLRSRSTQRAAPEAVGSVGAVAGPDLLSTLYRRFVFLLSFAGAGVLVVGLFPQRVGRIAAALESRPGRSALVGTLGSGFLLLFSVLFAIVTFGLGIPVSMVVMGVLGLAWLLGFVGLCQVVGDQLPMEHKPHGRWLAFLVGTVLLTFLGSLPLIGWLVVFAASAAGVGAALSTRFGGR